MAVLIFNPIWVLASDDEIETEKAKLQKPDIYKPTATTLATYCQSDQSLFPYVLSPAWFPREGARLGMWCQVSTNYAHVGYGRSYHFGYDLQLDKAASIPTTNVWNLFLVGEEQPDKLLVTFQLACTQHVSALDIEDLLYTNFDQMIKDNEPEGYIRKVMAQIRFGRMALAGTTCKDWIKAKPDSWLACFTYAHIRCRLGETEAAAAQFKDWVNAHQSFGNDIYLALFNYSEGRTNEAVEAVRTALTQPLVESPDEGANIFYLAYNGTLIEYAGGDFDACLSLCDKMLAYDNYDADVFKRNALRIKAAAMFMKGKQAAAIGLMAQAENVNGPDSFSHDNAKSDRVLQNAIQKNEIEFVREPGNWDDGKHTWFTPFTTEESEWSGSDFPVPTPYPVSWKTDPF